MPIDVNTGFDVNRVVVVDLEDGSSIAILGSDEDPSIVGQSAPVGSILAKTSGALFQKLGPSDLNWFTIPNLLAAYGESESESSTSSATFQQKLSLSFVAVNAEYLLQWYLELSTDSPGNRINVRLQQDDTITHASVNTIPDANAGNGWGVFTGVRKIMLTAGMRTFDIDFSSQNQGPPTKRTVRIRRTRIIITRLKHNADL